MIRRPPRSTLRCSSAASDVYKRQVCMRACVRARARTSRGDCKCCRCARRLLSPFISLQTTQSRKELSGKVATISAPLLATSFRGIVGGVTDWYAVWILRSTHAENHNSNDHGTAVVMETAESIMINPSSLFSPFSSLSQIKSHSVWLPGKINGEDLSD